MKQKGYTTEEIIRILREADQSRDLEAVCHQHDMSAASFYRWKKFGGMELKDARKYRQLEKENAELEADARRWFAQDPGARRSGRKKERRAIQDVVKAGLCSERRACRYLGVHRFGHRHTSKQPSDWLLLLHAQIERLSHRYHCPGYRKLMRLLRREGWQVGRKLVQCIRREPGLRVKRRSKRPRRRGKSHRHHPDAGPERQPCVELGLPQ